VSDAAAQVGEPVGERGVETATVDGLPRPEDGTTQVWTPTSSSVKVPR
jgi:hypothetical protein